jgi:hypothetical protein
VPERSEEATVSRKLYYQDSYGRRHRDRKAERNSGGSSMPGGFLTKALLVLAVLVVLASYVH